jgi:hypothetical protein
VQTSLLQDLCRPGVRGRRRVAPDDDLFLVEFSGACLGHHLPVTGNKHGVADYLNGPSADVKAPGLDRRGTGHDDLLAGSGSREIRRDYGRDIYHEIRDLIARRGCADNGQSGRARRREYVSAERPAAEYYRPTYPRPDVVIRLDSERRGRQSRSDERAGDLTGGRVCR